MTPTESEHLARLEAQLEQMRRALEPFAHFHDVLRGQGGQGEVIYGIHYTSGSAELTRSALAAARAALSPEAGRPVLEALRMAHRTLERVAESVTTADADKPFHLCFFCDEYADPRHGEKARWPNHPNPNCEIGQALSALDPYVTQTKKEGP